MNIIIFTNLFPNKSEPERGNFIALMTEKLAKMSDVKVISPLPWFPNTPLLKKIPQLKKWNMLADIPSTDVYGNIRAHYPKYFFLPKIGYIFQAVSIFLNSYSILKKLHQQNNIDIINAHWIFPDAVAAVYASKKLNIPCVISARGCDINRFSHSYIKRIQINWALQHASAITVVSEALKNKIIEIYNIDKQKIHIIPNGVDESIFHRMQQQESRSKLSLDKDKKILLFVGQLHPVKNIELLLNALSIIKSKEQLNFETLIIGSGPLESELKQLSQQLKLTPNDITFKGQQEHGDIALYFGASDLLCLPSIREGRPNVIIEALATGLPVVASNIGGIPELVNDSNGKLISPTDPEQLASALIAAINKSWDRDTISSNQTTSSWGGCAQQYKKLFLDLL